MLRSACEQHARSGAYPRFRVETSAQVRTLPSMEPRSLAADLGSGRTGSNFANSRRVSRPKLKPVTAAKSAMAARGDVETANSRTDPPPICSLQPMTPPALDHLVKRCLAKDPEDRWQSARDLCGQLRWISDSGPATGVAVPAGLRKNLKGRAAWIVSALTVAIALISVAVLYLHRTPPAEKQSVRFAVGPPEGGLFPAIQQSYFSVSPDGSKLVFAADVGPRRSQLWIRSLDSQKAQALPGTENASSPFWSPDSRFVAFSADRKLKKIAIDGGPVETLAEGESPLGSWSREGVVLFHHADDGRLYRVSESGGNATPVTTLDASRSEILQRLTSNQVLERLSLQQLHSDEVLAVRFVDFVDRAYIRVIER
jgi:serine/threonine protein kinase